MVDMFAAYYLLSSPSIRPGIHNANKAFGFREYWSGVGVFVFKEGENFLVWPSGSNVVVASMSLIVLQVCFTKGG